jgi:hypothetical protein
MLVALKFFGVVDDGSSLYLSLSTLLVEALPSLLTIVLLIRYHSGSMKASRGSDIGVSLLTREADHTCIDAAVVCESRDIESIVGSKSKPANVDHDREKWLAQFIVNGRVIGAAKLAPVSTENIAAQEEGASSAGV